MLGRLASRLWKLGPRTHDFDVSHATAITTPDDVTLVHAHFRPRSAEPLPTILVRTPYDRRDFFAAFWYARFAERGYHVIVQDCRGRFGSTGEFEPFTHERRDGLATLDWLGRQPWFDGRLGMWGASYNAYTQWAIADDDRLTALAPMNAISQAHAIFHPNGALALDALLSWTLFTAEAAETHGRPWPSIRRLIGVTRKLARLPWNTLPAGRLDVPSSPASAEFFRSTCTELPATHPFWVARQHADRVARTHAAVHLLSGWHDVFLADTLADYQRLCAAGKAPHLTIGGLAHGDMRTQVLTLQFGLAWFDRQLKRAGPAAPDVADSPVHLFITGAEQWRDFPAWPPPATPHTLHLAAGAALDAAPPTAAAAVTSYRYDPGDPTPSLGGATLLGKPVVDNRPLEARADVRTFTGPPLAAPLEAIGAPRLVLFVRCSLPYFDIFARICEVAPDGRSHNISDAIVRCGPGRFPVAADGCTRVELDLSPIAHRFAAGARVRLLVASGAHPRFARNPGTGIAALDAIELRAADVELHHDVDHPSGLVLPLAQLSAPAN